MTAIPYGAQSRSKGHRHRCPRAPNSTDREPDSGQEIVVVTIRVTVVATTWRVRLEAQRATKHEMNSGSKVVAQCDAAEQSAKSGATSVPAASSFVFHWHCFRCVLLLCGRRRSVPDDRTERIVGSDGQKSGPYHLFMLM